MHPLQTAANYDQIAHHWASKDFNQANGIAQHERAIGFLDSRGPAIDIGCGSSGRIIDLLLKNRFKAEGLDISTEMLSLAKTKNPNVDFYQGDICQWQFPKQYDFISAWDSVWHVPLEQQPTVIQKLCDGLAPGGVLIVTTGGTDGPGEATNPFLGQPLYHSTIGISKLLRLVDESGVVCRHLEFDQGPEEKHVYLVVQKT